MSVRISRIAGRYAAPALICVLWIGAPAQESAAPTVRFTFDFPASNPLHYEVSILADGHGSYSSRTRPEADSASSVDSAHEVIETYQTDFTTSPSTAAHIFDLAQQARYFEGTLDSGNKHLAFTGAKTLSYDAPGHSTHATYNYSSIPAVRQLTEIFQDLSAALDFARRLDHDLHYQKLALEDELKRLEEMVNEGRLQEIFPLVPLLQKIVDDPAIVNVSRSRAQCLLAKAGPGGK